MKIKYLSPESDYIVTDPMLPVASSEDASGVSTDDVGGDDTLEDLFG